MMALESFVCSIYDIVFFSLKLGECVKVSLLSDKQSIVRRRQNQYYKVCLYLCETLSLVLG